LIRHEPANNTLASPEAIGGRIAALRGRKVLLDVDLAKLYGVRTSRRNEQVKRNRGRFPADFAFRVTDHELRILMSQIATSSSSAVGHGGTRKRPLVFTERGAMMVRACSTPREQSKSASSSFAPSFGCVKRSRGTQGWRHS
jgi:hypothetical protein